MRQRKKQKYGRSTPRIHLKKIEIELQRKLWKRKEQEEEEEVETKRIQNDVGTTNSQQTSDRNRKKWVKS